MYSFIRFVKCRLNLSLDWKWSRSIPRIEPVSATPMSRVPPSVFRKAAMVFRTVCSILLSGSPVCKLVLKVDLNSIFSFSPFLIRSMTSSGESVRSMNSLGFLLLNLSTSLSSKDIFAPFM